MPAQIATSVENNFTKGLITEATGLNFPENAATDTNNCIYTLIGDVTRREGITFEANGTTVSSSVTNLAMSSYVWNNPGGDGNSKLLVKQLGGNLFFYNIATSTVAAPLSTQLLVGSVDVSSFVVAGGTFDATKECSFTDGNGYLFVFQSTINPIYVSYNAGTQAVLGTPIAVQVRDFTGVPDNLQGASIAVRPSTLSAEHQYNLQNQGWTAGNPWFTTATSGPSTTVAVGTSINFTVFDAGLPITNGNSVRIAWYPFPGSGYQTQTVIVVTNYTGHTLTGNVISYFSNLTSGNGWTASPAPGVQPVGTGYISTWLADIGNYPSNADVWWYYKDNTGVFNPTTTIGNITLAQAQAPQGHYIMPAFNMDFTAASGIAGLTAITTTNRPSTGTWFQGRVWYTGVTAFQAAAGDAAFYTWTENIYFSQVVSTPDDFGNCYQTNDPSSEQLNSLLPTDGGVITIHGTGTIHRLWPVANGLLVFANNGVWFITGSQGIGFSANDYTITQISHSPVLSHQSFVDVLGLPMYWNEDGIYMTQASQNGKLGVEPITVGTILTYFNAIPVASKKYARGSYDPINFVVQWCFKTQQETSVTDRYQYDAILNYNTYNKAFYPYAIGTTNTSYIHGIDYVSYPYITTVTPLPGFKYHCSSAATNNGFAEEYDTNYVDWGSVDYSSYFVTGYKVHGKGMFRFQIPYINLFTRDVGPSQFYLQSVWDFGTKSFNSNKWSNPQLVEINESNTEVSYRRIKIRGRGLVMQIKVSSISGQPFDIMGWAMFEVVNSGV